MSLLCVLLYVLALSSVMPPNADSSRSGTPELISAPGLSVVALVLFVLFALLVATALFPLQLLDPAWQLRLAGTLINTAPFPLAGLALLQIAAELGPHDPQLKNRAHLCAQLAVTAALGFLLLLPLQTIAGLQTNRTINNAQAARIQGAEAKLKALRQAVAGAASNADLNVQLQKLSGPVLGPADIAQPLPLLKAQVGAVLDQAALQISREREANQPRTPLLLLPDLLRKALASLALALGFAAMARRPGSDLSLLQELQSRIRRSKQSRSARRSGTTDADYLQQLSRGDRDP